MLDLEQFRLNMRPLETYPRALIPVYPNGSDVIFILSSLFLDFPIPSNVTHHVIVDSLCDIVSDLIHGAFYVSV